MTRAMPLTCLILLLGLAPAASAQDSSSGSSFDRPHADRGPPPEAYAACADKTAGASVTITLRDGRTVEGVCEQHGDRLAARPLQRPEHAPGDGGGPPAN
jgi:hypothetical protein